VIVSFREREDWNSLLGMPFWAAILEFRVYTPFWFRIRLVSLNHPSSEATDIQGQIKMYSDKQHQPEYQQIFLISHMVEKTSLVYHNNMKDEKCTAHSCSKGNLTSQMRKSKNSGRSYIILQVLCECRDFSFIRIFPSVLKPARFSNKSSCEDAIFSWMHPRWTRDIYPT